MAIEMDYRPLVQRRGHEPATADDIIEIMGRDEFVDAFLALNALAKTGFFNFPELDQQVAFALVDRTIPPTV